MPTTSSTPWWQVQQLPVNQGQHFRLGPLNLYVQRKAQQWILAHEYNKDEKSVQATQTEISLLPVHLTGQRFMFSQSPAKFRLVPRLLDRPVVVKTLQSVNLPPNEQTTFYISSPIVLQVTLQQPELVLQEIMLQRLSDTWFGPSTQVGELCYADKTHARYSKQELPARSHRAVTPVTIVNKSPQMLTIDKLSIPLPFLSLYSLPDGSLWTDPVTLQHEGSQALAHFATSKLSAADAPGAIAVSTPRIKAEKHSLFRAFADIFTD